MKKLTVVLWIVIAGIFGLVIYQNQDFLLSDQSLGINFYFAAYRTIPLPTAVLFGAVFFIGFLIAYVFGLANRYHSNRRVKSLQQKIATQQRAIDSLTKERDALKPDAPLPGQSPSKGVVEPPKDTTDPPSAAEVNPHVD